MSGHKSTDLTTEHTWRRLGHLAFWFFLIKGLAWLAAPAVLYFWL